MKTEWVPILGQKSVKKTHLSSLTSLKHTHMTSALPGQREAAENNVKDREEEGPAATDTKFVDARQCCFYRGKCLGKVSATCRVFMGLRWGTA
uniref:cDNA n=1 Tax=Panagrellus redivivus TaxID=6233 RepID=A0A7E4VIJ3_PANRE